MLRARGGAAGYVEKQAVIAIERDKGCVAVAPVSEALEQPKIGLTVGFDYLDRRMHGLRVGNAHTGP